MSDLSPEMAAHLDSILGNWKEADLSRSDLDGYEHYLTSDQRRRLFKGWDGMREAGEELAGVLERFPDVDALTDEFSANELRSRLSLKERLAPLVANMIEATDVLRDIQRQVDSEISGDLFEAYGVIKALKAMKPEMWAAIPNVKQYMRGGRKGKSKETSRPEGSAGGE